MKTIHLFTKYNLYAFDNVKKFNKCMRAEGYPDYQIENKDFNLGRAVELSKDDGLVYVIYFNKKVGIPNIIHELSHIVSFLMESIGVDDDEFRAYTLEYITEGLLNAFKIKH